MKVCKNTTLSDEDQKALQELGSQLPFAKLGIVCECRNKCDNCSTLIHDIPLSRKNTSVDIWGPITWKFLHCVSVQRKTEDLIKMMKCLQFLLPCEMCRESFKGELKNILPSLTECKTSNQVKLCVIELHNRVNLRLSKKKFDDSMFNLEEHSNAQTLEDAAKEVITHIRHQLTPAIDLTPVPHESADVCTLNKCALFELRTALDNFCLIVEEDSRFSRQL